MHGKTLSDHRGAILQKRWKPIRASRNGPLLSNLFFAYDIILFAEADVDQASVIHDCLSRFCEASGQCVSLAKSRVFFSKNVNAQTQENIAAALAMESTSDLVMYLGMPTLTSRVTKETFSHLCEKIDRRLAGWKTKYLSLAGRMTLAKSTLSTLANYSMQSAKIPRNVCEEIDRKTRKFIWGGDEDRRKTHLLSWETLQKPRQHGGIGIRSAQQANDAFLTKLGWRVLSEPNALWSRVIRAKYCKGRCDIDMFTSKSGASNVWRGITENSRLLCEGLKMAVGNGRSTLFWNHAWATDKPLSNHVLQPIPPELAGATVDEMWDHSTGWKWDTIAPFLHQDTLKLIQAFELKNDPEMADLVYWKDAKQGKFSIRSAFSLMRHDSDTLDEKCWEAIWNAPVQQRIRAFMWVACHDRVLGNLNRYKRRMTDEPKCYICGADEESTLHILRDCPAARLVWRKIGGPAW